MSVAEPSIVACRLTLDGHVQGIGLRPAIARLASEHRLDGHVRNSASGVEIHIEGEDQNVETFCCQLAKLPVLAACVEPAITSHPAEPQQCDGFRIRGSNTVGPLTTRVPRDRAACHACLKETEDERDCRYGYEFTSCTDCGPRYSVVESMPFDRSRTTMQPFDLCARCQDEYATPSNRRFHAQTNACPECGPSVSQAIKRIAGELVAGKILGLKGLGGYQLVVDATNAAAIRELRKRKRRPSKPLAVMFQMLQEVEGGVSLTDLERSVLCGPERPIVVARIPPCSYARQSVDHRHVSPPSGDGSYRVTGTELCHDELHPGLNELGVFLPTTPLHKLLLKRTGRPLVVTSGNVDGDPLAMSAGTAERDLAHIADVWLHHDRQIVHAIDDSVVRVIAKRPVTIRNARGFAPLPLPALERFARRLSVPDQPLPSILATGGQQKTAIALFNGHQAVLGPHLGDMDTLASRQRFEQHVEQFQSLYRCRPGIIAHDSHPDYFTTCWAESQSDLQSERDGRGTTRQLSIQHHHAHVVSAMVENDWLEREVLGVAFDGTGAGTDGTIWGGEFLRATASEFERVAHLRPFRLPGSQMAIREPWRIAMSLLFEAGCHDAASSLAAAHCSSPRETVALAQSSVTPVTTSAGRLFDGVAALVLEATHTDFEGQPAMQLESAASVADVSGSRFVCGGGRGRAPRAPSTRTAGGSLTLDPSHTSPAQASAEQIEKLPTDGLNSHESSYGLPLQRAESDCLELDWRPMIRQILSDISNNVPCSAIAAKFHLSLARAVADVCIRFQLPVVLSGGVFQNRLLTECLVDALHDSELDVACHSAIPPNDGGLSAGQLAIAMAQRLAIH